MLETIREYARELLEEGGEGDAMRRRHADHYLAGSELAYTEPFDRGLTWSRRLEPEHDNLRAALDFLRDRDPVRYLGLAGALGWFWEARSHFAEGSRRLEDALASPVEDDPLTARALTSLGSIDASQGRSAEDALRLEGTVGTKWNELGASLALPFVEAWRERELGAARARLGEPRASVAFDEGRAMTWDQAIELALGKKSAT
jgi:hypothetical protein